MSIVKKPEKKNVVVGKLLACKRNQSLCIRLVIWLHHTTSSLIIAYEGSLSCYILLGAVVKVTEMLQLPEEQKESEPPDNSVWLRGTKTASKGEDLQPQNISEHFLWLDCFVGAVRALNTPPLNHTLNITSL